MISVKPWQPRLHKKFFLMASMVCLFSQCQTPPNADIKYGGVRVDDGVPSSPENARPNSTAPQDIIAMAANDSHNNKNKISGLNTEKNYIEADLLAALEETDSEDETNPLENGANNEASEQGHQGKDVAESTPEAPSGTQLVNVSSGKSLLEDALAHENNPYVQKWIKYFTSGAGKSRFQRYLERGSIYQSLIHDILARYDVPKELYYLALIESGFLNNAKSRASAVGVWQFIRGTAVRYGLEVNSYIDERRDPVRATIAAANYLIDLHRVYQDWYLAMAGYNAGEVRVLRAVMTTSERNFWKLIEEGKLPRETMNYVPKFIAALIIGENPERFGISPSAKSGYPKLKPVKVNSYAYLKDIARSEGISAATLKALNPHVFRGKVVSKRSYYNIWAPEKADEGVDNSLLVSTASGDSERYLAQVSSSKSKSYKSRKVAEKSQKFHRVRRGETLLKIAAKYRVTLRELKSVNRLKSNRINAGVHLKIPGTRYL